MVQVLAMARLNISLPDDLYEVAKRWRGTKNLSEICARALREELEAAELARTAEGLLTALRHHSDLEKSLMKRYHLRDARVAETPEDPLDLSESLGAVAAKYLDSQICDDSLLAIAGGRQMWGVVRNLSPRSVRVTITALGIHENDPKVLHVHPNTLTTLLWLLYSPGAVAKLVAASSFDALWNGNLSTKERPSYFVVASCGPFVDGSPFAHLIGEEATQNLVERGAANDFAYVFFNTAGELIDPPEYRIPPVGGIDHSLFSAQSLRDLSRRPDARILVVAGGEKKLPALRSVLRNQLCNVVITDKDTATALLC